MLENPMSTILSSNIDWRKEIQYPWTDDKGLARLNGIIIPFLPFEP